MQVNFGRVSRKDIGSSKKVVITRGDASKLDPKLQAGDTPGLKTELKTIKPGEHYELVVTLISPLPEKRFVSNLTLETGSPEAPTAAVRVFASIPPHVVANPRYIKVPQERDAAWEQRVRLEWDDEAPHKVLSATVGDPKLNVQVEDENGTQVVVVSVPEDYSPVPRGPSVTIRTDDAKVPVLTVPVIAARAPKLKRAASPPQPSVGRTNDVSTTPDASRSMTPRPEAARTNSVKSAAPGPGTAESQQPKPDSGGSESKEAQPE